MIVTLFLKGKSPTEKFRFSSSHIQTRNSVPSANDTGPPPPIWYDKFNNYFSCEIGRRSMKMWACFKKAEMKYRHKNGS